MRRVHSSPVRILVADDHEMIRKGLRLTLQDRSDWLIVGEARDGQEAIEKAIALAPDVVIMDIAMPAITGLEATRRIRARRPATHVLILTIHDTGRTIAQVLDAGAQGYLLKSDSGRDLVRAIETICEGGRYFTSRVARMIVEGYLSGNTDALENPLSGREREILQLIAEGQSTKEIASRLAISRKTAETHRTNLMKKIGARSVAAVVRYAVRNGIVEA